MRHSATVRAAVRYASASPLPRSAGRSMRTALCGSRARSSARCVRARRCRRAGPARPRDRRMTRRSGARERVAARARANGSDDRPMGLRGVPSRSGLRCLPSGGQRPGWSPGAAALRLARGQGSRRTGHRARARRASSWLAATRSASRPIEPGDQRDVLQSITRRGIVVSEPLPGAERLRGSRPGGQRRLPHGPAARRGRGRGPRRLHPHLSRTVLGAARWRRSTPARRSTPPPIRARS